MTIRATNDAAWNEQVTELWREHKAALILLERDPSNELARYRVIQTFERFAYRFDPPSAPIITRDFRAKILAGDIPAYELHPGD